MRKFNSTFIPVPRLPDSVTAALASSDFDIEIGAGRGLHAVQYCKAHPNRILVAIERTHSKFAGLRSRKSSHTTLHNLVIAQADAVAVITHFVKDKSIRTAFLLYPNPYPKSKQANLRWHNMPFMSELHRKLQIGGRLILATNIPIYGEEAQTKLTDQGLFELETCEQIGFDSPGRTHFEKRYLARREVCMNYVFRKSTLQ